MVLGGFIQSQGCSLPIYMQSPFPCAPSSYFPLRTPTPPCTIPGPLLLILMTSLSHLRLGSLQPAGALYSESLRRQKRHSLSLSEIATPSSLCHQVGLPFDGPIACPIYYLTFCNTIFVHALHMLWLCYPQGRTSVNK